MVSFALCFGTLYMDENPYTAFFVSCGSHGLVEEGAFPFCSPAGAGCLILFVQKGFVI